MLCVGGGDSSEENEPIQKFVLQNYIKEFNTRFDIKQCNF